MFVVLHTLQYCITRRIKIVYDKLNSKSGEAAVFIDRYCERFRYFRRYHDGEIATVIPTVASMNFDDTLYLELPRNKCIKDVVTNVQLYDSAALWVIEEFLKVSPSLTVENNVTIDMRKRMLRSEVSYIDIYDNRGYCYLDDKEKLHAAIVKMMLSLQSVTLSISSISVSVEVNKSFMFF
jgi:hypothetical protein